MDIKLRNFSKDDYFGFITMSDDYWKTSHLCVATSMMKATGNIEHCILAVDGTKIVGYIYGFALPNKTLIPEFLYVLPTYRQNGIGKRLVEELEIVSECSSSMIFYHKDLHDFYGNMGYEVGDALEAATKQLPVRKRQKDEA